MLENPDHAPGPPLTEAHDEEAPLPVVGQDEAERTYQVDASVGIERMANADNKKVLLTSCLMSTFSRNPSSAIGERRPNIVHNTTVPRDSISPVCVTCTLVLYLTIYLKLPHFCEGGPAALPNSLAPEDFER